MVDGCMDMRIYFIWSNPVMYDNELEHAFLNVRYT